MVEDMNDNDGVQGVGKRAELWQAQPGAQGAGDAVAVAEGDGLRMMP
jgi:hypothetical protein